MTRKQVRNSLSLLVAACFMLSAAGFIELARGPYFGLRAAAAGRGRYIAGPAERGSPLELASGSGSAIAGAELESVAGLPVGEGTLVEDPDYLGTGRRIAAFFAFQDEAWVAASGALEGGPPVRFGFAPAAGGTVSVDARPVRMGFARAASRTWLMLVLGYFSLATGYLLAMRRPEDPNALRFFAMTLSVALIFSSFGVYTARDVVLCPPVFRALFVQNTLAFVSFFCFFPWFFLHFPSRKAFLSKKAWRLAAYAVAAAAAVAGVTRVFGSLSNAFFLAALVVGSGALLHGYVKARSLVERYQVRWILLGTFAFVAVFCATAIVPSLLTGQRLVSDKVPSLFFALIPLSILASIEKYRLLDIDRIIDASLAYLAVLAIVASIDVLVVYLLLASTPFDPSSAIVASSLFVCLAFSLAYAPLRALTVRAIKAALKRPEVHSVSAMLGVSSALSGAGSPEEACAAFEGFLAAAFGSRSAAVEAWIDGRAVRPPSPPVPGLDGLGTFPREPAYLHAFMPGGLAAEHVDSVFIPTGRFLEAANGGEPAGSGFSGYVILARRSMPSMYSRADLALLRALSQEFTHFVDGLLARDRARKAETAMLLERERIARDIHDGLGGALGTSLMLLDGLAPEASGPEAASRVTELRRILDDGLGELRALVWTMNDDESDVEALALVIRDRLMPPLKALGHSCSVTLGQGVGTIRLPSRARMGVYRIAQEFLANCAKHSMPGKLGVRFELSGGSLGCGFTSRAAAKATKAAGSDNLHGGKGSLNMERRAAELGASLSSEVKGDERTLVLALPLGAL